MKTKTIAVLAIVLLLSLTLMACAQNSPTQPAPQPDPAPAEDASPDQETYGEDFVLTISVEQTSLPQGEDFRVDVELKNNSGEDREIVYSILFWPSIPDWHPFGGIAIDPPEPQSRLFEANGTMRNIGIWGSEDEPWLVGFDLEPGTHELRFRATFWLANDEQQVEVWSNAVLLTVQ